MYDNDLISSIRGFHPRKLIRTASSAGPVKIETAIEVAKKPEAIIASNMHCKWAHIDGANAAEFGDLETRGYS